MIRRIEIDGFKSLRGFALDLEPLTAIVGANGAGKSNLLDALHLLSRLAQVDVTEALRSGRGAIRDQFSRTRDGAAERIRICADVLLGADSSAARAGAPVRIRCEVVISRALAPSGIEDIFIDQEELAVIPGGADAWIARHPGLASRAQVTHQRDERAAFSYALPSNEGFGSLLKVREKRTRYGHPTRARFEGGAQEAGISDLLVDELCSIHIAHFEPSKLRLPSERAAGAALAADGSNLPTALAALAPEARAQIRADLAELIPGFRTFEVVPADEELRLEVEFTDGARVPARVLSDGTLRLIALLTLLRGSTPGALIAVEEPENGIYPGRLRALVEKLVDATTPRGDVLPPQVLLTSHSPAILAALHGRPESLVFADLIRHGDDLRSTRMRRVRAEDSDRQARDPSTVSRREIERILDSARPEDEA